MKRLFFEKLFWIIVLAIILLGCVTVKKSIGENATATTPTPDNFGCSPPPSCDSMNDPFARQFCEDWRAGKDVWSTIPDCSFMATEGCRKLCQEKTKGKTKQMSSIPSGQLPAGMPNVPSMDDVPQMPSSSDLLFHPRKPFCIETDDYRAQLVYVRPADAPDRYDEISKNLKQWMPQANGIVNNEAARFGMTADIKVACKGNEISVLNVVLPKSASHYNTHDGKTTLAVVANLKELGYGDSKVKYILYYDGDADGCEGGKAKCSGQFSSKAQDDRPSEDNGYNSGPDYSILYDVGFSELVQKTHSTLEMLAPIGILHEYSHTLGAVQSSAPHSSKDGTVESGHCNDEHPMNEGGNDVMCKSDKPDTVFGDACQDTGFVFRYDCNNDDYFNPKPEAGSYLATHWNIGSPLNHFFMFGTAEKSQAGLGDYSRYGNVPGDYTKYSAGNFPTPPSK
ncbi:hypothetical protein HYX14_03490 [Candidatus Woesearchaeota archaeon]|nr:hypothetical protein [Candidatus Woesearchaeota archaeon]